MIETIFLYIAIIAIVIAVIVIAVSADEVKKNNKDGKNKEFKKAENLLIASAITGAVAGLFALWIALRSSNEKYLPRSDFFRKGWVKGILFLTFIALAVSSGLAFAAYSEMKKDKSTFGSVEKTAAPRSKTGALLAAVSAVFVLIALLFTFTKPSNKELLNDKVVTPEEVDEHKMKTVKKKTHPVKKV